MATNPGQRQVRDTADTISDWLDTQGIQTKEPEELKAWIVGLERIIERLKSRLPAEEQSPEAPSGEAEGKKKV